MHSRSAQSVAGSRTLCATCCTNACTGWRWAGKFIASFSQAPVELVLDFDATDNPLHGSQQEIFFHGFTTSSGWRATPGWRSRCSTPRRCWPISSRVRVWSSAGCRSSTDSCARSRPGASGRGSGL
ncbi:MAG: transposase [Burkholderiaceae bacterium]|nr:transposase [Burkholderiaceae bacterium]